VCVCDINHEYVPPTDVFRSVLYGVIPRQKCSLIRLLFIIIILTATLCFRYVFTFVSFFSSLFPNHVSAVYNLIRLFAYGYTAHIIISVLLNFFNKRNAHTTPLIIAFAYTEPLFDFCPNLAGLYRTNSLLIANTYTATE